MILDENLKQLELPLLLKKLSELVRTPYGDRYMEEISIKQDQQILERELREVTEMTGLLEGGYNLPLSELTDIRSFLDRLKPEDAFLEPSELNLVKSNLQLADELSLYIKKYQDHCPNLIRYADRIHSHRAIIREIDAILEPDGEIRENASRELKQIRKEISRLENEQKQLLNSVIKRYKDFSQDDIVTMRDGRMVLGIQQQYVNKINGIVHGTSGTGVTVFVEPMETLRISNQIQNQRIEERKEIIRLLKFISGLIREVREDIFFSLENVGILDFIHAKARFSLHLNASEPQITTEPRLYLVDGRHPLLILKVGYDNVVPATLEIGEDFHTLVITGPNAGGKTVTLKMAGLLCVMAMMGLHIPANSESCIPILDNILVDIGDRQDLEQDLSTFSAHILRLGEILKKATSKSLVLLDEIGTGTDPREGSSLAVSILNELTQGKSLTVATTHHGELKAYAYNTDGVENGSMEFNLDTLIPTYRLQVGIPGSSYAFEIARRYGLPEEILNNAIALLGSEKNQLENLIISLNERLQETEKERRDISIKLSESEGLRNLYQKELKKLQQEKTELRRSAAEEASKIIRDANTTIEHLVAEIRKSNAHRDTIREAHSRMKEMQEQARQIIRETQPQAELREEIRAGDIVWIETLREAGEVLSDPDGGEKVWVLVNDMRMNLSTDILRKAPKNKSKAGRIRRRSGVNDSLEKGVQPEIDLRGMDSFQALEATNRYLDQALQEGWDEIRIIHGKGTGVLRREVNNFLNKDNRVDQKRLGKWGEGDTGVTIVKLRKQ